MISVVRRLKDGGVAQGMTPVGGFLWSSFFLLAGFHLAAILGLFFVSWDWSACFLGSGLYVIGMCGGIGNHRYWSHGSFKARRWVEYMLAFAGGITGHGTIRDWQRNHHQHHEFADSPGDPHSPWQYPNRLRGFWWAYMGWNFWEVLPPEGYTPRGKSNYPVIQWQDRWYLPIFIGGVLGPGLWLGWSGVWIAGVLRYLAGLHGIWALGSLAHLFGDRPTYIQPPKGHAGDLWWLSFISNGEGWHFKHHAHPQAAILGPRWYQPDFGKWIIRTLQIVGGVTHVTEFDPPLVVAEPK